MSDLPDSWRGSYVQRRGGVIVGAFLTPQPGIAEEPLPEDDAELRAFLSPPPPKRKVPKSVIVSRLIAAEKIGAAYTALNSNAEYWARWVASDRPAINYDDPDALALLRAIGADPDVILAP